MVIFKIQRQLDHNLLILFMPVHEARKGCDKPNRYYKFKNYPNKNLMLQYIYMQQRKGTKGCTLKKFCLVICVFITSQLFKLSNYNTRQKD